MIEFKNLTKIYPSKRKYKKDVVALDHLNVTLPDTGMVFIIGKSGSGKSTLLNLIGGLDKITEGDIIADGNSLSAFHESDFTNYRCSYVGFIFQDYHLLDEFTVRENIELGGDIAGKNVDLSTLLAQVDLEGLAERYPHELSGGQQQRVAIARAISKDVKVLLADEPTGNLDKNTSKQVLDLLKELSKTRLVIIVSHNQTDATTYADRIISLDHGRIVLDQERVENYNNTLRMEEDTLYLPHHHDLDEKELAFVRSKRFEIKKVYQIGSGMVPTQPKEISKEQAPSSLGKSRLPARKFGKLFKSFFTQGMGKKAFTILIASILLTLFYIFQAFSVTSTNDILLHEMRTNGFTSIPVYKREYNTNTNLYNNLYEPLGETDLEFLQQAGYEGETYTLYNYSIPLNNGNISRLLTSPALGTSLYMLYIKNTLGTVVCDRAYLNQIFGKNGEAKVLYGHLEDKAEGMIITDYMADSLCYYYPNLYPSRESVIGPFTSNGYTYAYVNAIIETGYESKYADLLSVYDKLFDDDLTNNNIVEELLDHEQFSGFVNEVGIYYAMGYTFNKNLPESIAQSEVINRQTVDNFTFKSIENTQNSYSTANNTSLIRHSTLKEGEVMLSTTLYNQIFGADYNKDNYRDFQGCTLQYTKNYGDTTLVTQNVKVVKLSNSSNAVIWASKDVYQTLCQTETVAYGLHLGRIDQPDRFTKALEDTAFKLHEGDTNMTGINVLNRALDIFANFLQILEWLSLAVCAFYLISFGYKNIRSKHYEIGVLSAIGGRKSSISLLFTLESLAVGVGIILLSLVGIFFGSMLANSILLASFQLILNANLGGLEIIRFRFNYAMLDLGIGMILILIASFTPMLFMSRIKPVDILKAKE